MRHWTEQCKKKDILEEYKSLSYNKQSQFDKKLEKCLPLVQRYLKELDELNGDDHDRNSFMEEYERIFDMISSIGYKYLDDYID